MSEQVVTVAAPVRRSLKRRLTLPGGAAILSIGTLASGLLAYVFNLLAARALGAAEYGPVAVLWAAMFLVSVVLFRPAEQTLARNIAERVTRGEDARGVARAVARMTLGALVAVTLVVAVTWSTLTDKLFDGHAYLTACLLASIAGYALSYYVRGLASGLQWLEGYGTLLLVDGGARVLVAVPLIAIASPQLAAVAIVVAAAAGGIAPLLVPGHGPRMLWARLAGSTPGPLGLREAARFALPVGVVAGAEQTLVSGGALLAVLTAGDNQAAAAGTVFAATMLVRAPVFLFQGVAAALLPRFTELHTLGEHSRIRRMLVLAVGAMVALSATLVAGALVCGPEVMKLLFGSDFVVARGDLAVLCAGVGCYLAAATLSQAALARGLAGRTALAWFTSATCFVVLQLTLTGSPLHRVSVAFTITTLLNALLLGLTVRSKN